MAVFLIGLIFISDTAPAVPQFPITDIQVIGARWVSETLVQSESGLEIGATYTESDLIRARGRIARLPFVLHADFSLKKGTVRGTYTLEIQVWEHKPLFHHYQFSARERDLPNPLPPRGPGSKEDTSADTMGNWSIGARWFAHAHGFLYAATSLEHGDDGLDFSPGNPVDLGYNHYNLLGHGLFLNLNVQLRDSLEDRVFDPYSDGQVLVRENRSPATTLTLAQPFGHRTQWLTLTLDYYDTELAFPKSIETDDVKENRFRANLGWYYDTTDDLALPTRGLRLEGGLDFGRVKSQFPVFFDQVAEASPTHDTFTVKALDARVELTIYHAFTSQFSGHARGLLRERIDEKGQFIRNPDQTHYQLQTGVNYKIWGSAAANGELRLESYALLNNRSDKFGAEETQTIHAGLVFRNAWGLMRAGFRYQKIDVDINMQSDTSGREKRLR